MNVSIMAALALIGVLGWTIAGAVERDGRYRRVAVGGVATLAVFLSILALAGPASASKEFERKVRSAPISTSWEPIVRLYSGSSYGVAYLNRLWRYCPRGPRRGIMLREAVEHRIPWRLLLAVYGAESSYGRARSYFGLTGYFPGRGTSGSFDRDAHLSAALWSKLYRSRYGRSAL